MKINKNLVIVGLAIAVLVLSIMYAKTRRKWNQCESDLKESDLDLEQCESNIDLIRKK
jgi:uncharacterized membrane protein YciS (DUF1049 family)